MTILPAGIKERIDRANKIVAIDEAVEGIEARFVASRNLLSQPGACSSSLYDAKCHHNATFRIVELKRFATRQEFYCKLELESQKTPSPEKRTTIEVFGRLWGPNTQVVDVDGEVGDIVRADFIPRDDAIFKAIEFPLLPIWANMFHLV